MGNCEVELDNIITCIPECWWNDFRLKQLCEGFVVGEYNHRFPGSPKVMSEFREGKENYQEFLRVDGHFQLGRTKSL